MHVKSLNFNMQYIEISRFDMQRDLLTCAGEREIGAVSRRLPDNPGELAYIIMYSRHLGFHTLVPSKWFPTIFYIL